MFHRLVSISLIAAVIACPLWCGTGLVHCCTAAESAQTAEPESCCCCSHETTPSQAEVPKDPQDESPEQCQGVCGGAVLGKPCELGEDQFPAFLLWHAGEQVAACRPSEHRAFIAGPVPSCSDNVGRSLRTLHASFLC